MCYFVDEPDENGEVCPGAMKEQIPSEEEIKKETAQGERKTK